MDALKNLLAQTHREATRLGNPQQLRAELARKTQPGTLLHANLTLRDSLLANPEGRPDRVELGQSAPAPQTYSRKDFFRP